MMKGRGMALVVALAMVLPFSSGCIVADSSRPGYAGQETYYYYPDNEVYYYPNSRRYYWFERGEWRYGAEPPPRFVLRERERVRIDMDHEPHTDHAKIKKSYPPGRYEKDDRKDDRKDERKDDRKDRGGY